MNFELDKARICVIGLGYVGLPLAVEFGKKYDTIGFDISKLRVNELQHGVDNTLEVSPDEMAQAKGLSYTSETADIAGCDIYVVTVPTPIDENKRPDLTPLEKASETVGKAMRAGAVIIYESTVFPGATEEVCAPILERESGLTSNQDFFLGYSPERINPGDKKHRLPDILKVTSGSTPQAADLVDDLYRSVIRAGTHKASSIRVAEAAKVIENTQRDLNIALVNELSLIFDRAGIDTQEVLEAAGTKWNFLPFRPGLVGGHCIGVDPYYLTHKAQNLGYHPEVILAGRRINDSMGAYVAGRVIKLMAAKNLQISSARALVLGLTFKEDCPDLRNTRVIDIVEELKTYSVDVDVHDPWADTDQAQEEYGISLLESPAPDTYDTIILAVGHHQFRSRPFSEIRSWGKSNAVVFDVKSVLPQEEVDGRL